MCQEDKIEGLQEHKPARIEQKSSNPKKKAYSDVPKGNDCMCTT